MPGRPEHILLNNQFFITFYLFLQVILEIQKTKYK